MGNLMRRYWVPALLSSEIAERDSAPVRVKLLGEPLLAFRDSSGRVGLIDEFCRHRGASLFFGRNEEGGIRCAYHGLKYDITGQCVDLPVCQELASQVKTKAYPCEERGGIVWTYMGPTELRPALPEIEWCTLPDSHRFVSKRWQESNYLQGMEGGIDTTHVSYVHRYELEQDKLHRNAISKNYIKADSNVVFDIKETPFGMTIFGRRKGEPDSYYWRITQWIFPWYTLVPPTGPHPIGGHMWIPIDDENCWAWSVNYYPHQPLSAEERSEMEAGKGIHVEYIPGTFRPVANKNNDYLIDRQAQKERRTYSGVFGLSMQDASLQESMGPIQDRSKEFLLPTDAAIVLARRRLYKTASSLQNGGEPLPGLDPATQRVRAASVLLDKSTNVEGWARDALVASADNPLHSL
jgi:nitrite reductase/ring-hydroxylating ferredoxin subunit